MGGAVSAVTNAVSSVVGGVTNALGITQAPKPQVIYVDSSKQADASGGASGTTGNATTPTAEYSQGQKQASGGMYASQRGQGAGGGAGTGGSTMLTGPTGVQEKDIALGKRTLLGE